jgi:O-antigen/teichoic acid export membrane protein
MASALNRFAHRAGTLGSATTAVALSSILSFPILLAQLGLSSWGKLAFAQALGLIVATFANWGYQSFGQRLVAGKTPKLQLEVLLDAARIRFLLSTSLFGICCLIILVLMPADFLAVASGAGAYMIGGLNYMWYFQGTDRTARALWFEAVPKIGAMWISILTLFLGGSLLTFSITFLFFSLITSLTSSIYLLGASRVFKSVSTCFLALNVMKATWPAAGSSALSLTYMAFPTVFVGLVAPSSLPTYALLERLVRFTSLALVPLTASIQSWLLIDEMNKKIDETIRKGVSIIGIYALVSGTVFWLGTYLFAETVAVADSQIPIVFISLASITLVSTISTQVIGPSFLSGSKNLKYVLISAGAGSIAWIITGPMLILNTGGIGAQASLAIAELTVLVVQLTRISAIRRGSKSSSKSHMAN